MRGDRVIVKDARNRLFVVRVWEETATHVYICGEERFRRLSKDYTSDLPPLGYPIESVFYYDPVVEQEFGLRANQLNEEIYGRLKPYKITYMARV